MIKKKVADLVEGDMVDLHNDPSADPKGENPMFEFEYATVLEIDRETPDCVCVYFDGFTCGFPPEHVVEVAE